MSSHWRKLLLVAVVVSLQLISFVPISQAKTFADVNTNDWFYPYTEQLATAGIISKNANYYPFQSLTRAELAKMAIESAKYQRLLTVSASQQSSFCDVNTNDWALPYVETLYRRNVVQGSNGSCSYGRNFLPYAKVTRAEAIKILLGIYGIPMQGSNRFADVAIGSWYEPYIATATSIGLVNGYNSSQFGPNAFLTRAEMSKIIVKLTEYASAHPSELHVPAEPSSSSRNNDRDRNDDTNTTPTPTPTTTATPTVSASPTPTAPHSTARFPAGAITFYALGDSLTEGENDETNMGGYPPRLQSKIEAVRPGSRVISLGSSGNDSSNVAQNQVPNALHGDADAALVLIGSNDMWNDCWNEGNDTSAGTISQYEENMESIMSRLSQAGIKIFVGLVDDQSRRPDAENICTSSAGRTRMSRIATSFNTIIRSKASRYNATIVDFYSSTIFTNSATLSDDGNHPNAAGYEAMARLWFNAISAQL